MNLNLFNKKTLGSHYKKLLAEYEELTRQLEAAQQELPQAESDLRTKEQNFQQKFDQSKSTHLNRDEKDLLFIRNQAEQRLRAVKDLIGDLQPRHRELQHKAEAPTRMAEAKETCLQLAKQRNTLQGELENSGVTIEKLEKRITGLEQRIDAETISAVQALADADGELTLPENFGNLDVELRVTRSALAGVKEKAEVITAELNALREQMEIARNNFTGNRAIVAELELMEKLPSFIEIFARASVAKHMSRFSHDPDRYVIEIPRNVVDEAFETLKAELSV